MEMLPSGIAPVASYDDLSRNDAPLNVGPHAWIQWKGTDVCMDVWCACGAQGHIDSDFVYTAKCASCGQVYAVSQVVRLYPVAPDSGYNMGEPTLFGGDDA